MTKLFRSPLPPALLAVAVLSIGAWADGPEAPGVPNFHQVSDHVYRGAQPNDEGWKSLSKLGIQVVVDLRREGEEHHSLNGEAEIVKAAGMKYVSIPMYGIVAPAKEQMTQVLTLLNSGENVFVHCKKGMDRTGTVIAAYRITHDHWPNNRALKEAVSLGMSWTELGMKRYIRALQPTEHQLAQEAPQPQDVSHLF